MIHYSDREVELTDLECRISDTFEIMLDQGHPIHTAGLRAFLAYGLKPDDNIEFFRWLTEV